MSYGRGPPPEIRGMTSLKVDNLTYRTTPDDLRRVFSKYGDLGDVYIPRDRFTKESRGFAFIRYYDERDATDAMDSLDGADLDGRDLRVQFAKYGRPTTPPYRRGPPRRYGGGYGGGSSGGRYGGRGRSRSRSRSRSRDRDRDRHRRSRRRRSRSRSRSASRSRSRSRSDSRSRSRSRSPRRRSRSPKSVSRSPKKDDSRREETRRASKDSKD